MMTYQDVNYISKILLQAEIALAKFLWVPRHFPTAGWKIMEVKNHVSSPGAVFKGVGKTLFLMWCGSGILLNCLIHKFELLVEILYQYSNLHSSSLLKLERNFLLIMITSFCLLLTEKHILKDWCYPLIFFSKTKNRLNRR